MFLKIYIICMASFILYCSFIALDSATGDNIYKKYRIKDDCDYQLPNQYSVVYNSYTKEYAVRFMHLDKFPHYLYLRRYVFIENTISDFGDIQEAIRFKDSCAAKGFAKMMFEQNKQKEAEKNRVAYKNDFN